MTRRDLIKLLLAGGAGAVFDVDKLLWVPKAIVTVPAMPTPDVYRANTPYVESRYIGVDVAIEGNDRTVIMLRQSATGFYVRGYESLERVEYIGDGRAVRVVDLIRKA